MKFKIFFTFLLIYVFLFNQVVAQVVFSKILPNSDDDVNLEFIELYNSWITDQSLSWFLLKDKSQKEYSFWYWDFLWSKETKKYFRNDTKILLNNSNEEIFLYDNSWILLDSFSYTWTIKNEEIIIIDLWKTIENNSWSIDENNSSASILFEWENNLNLINDSWSIETNLTWSIDFWTWEYLTWVLDNFILIYSFQNPSYILDKQNISDEYICDNSKNECKINLDLRNSFTWSFKENDYECKIDFWFNWWLNWEENNCNPSTITFPKWDYNLNFQITEKNNSWNIFTWWFLLKNIVEEKIVEIEKTIVEEKIVYVDKIIYKEKESDLGNERVVTNKKDDEDIIIKNPKIIIQSWLDENNNCKKEDCSLNLNYEIKNKQEKCLWDFDWWKFSEETQNKCNPWYVKYGLWNFEVKLKVFQEWNESNYKESFLSFENKKIIKQKEIVEIEKTIIEDKVEKNIIDIESEILNNIDYNKNENILVEDNNLDKELIDDNIKKYSKDDKIFIYKVLVNPVWNDDIEYLEIINKSDNDISLEWCYLDDIIDWWSKKYFFDKDDIIKKSEIKKYDKQKTKIILNNNNDEINLFCNDILVDNLSWKYNINEWEILDHFVVNNKAKKILNENKLDEKNILINYELKKNYSDEIKIEEKIKPIISLQWKIWTNKILKWNILTCIDNCSINFDWTNSEWKNIEKYIWDFWNGQTFEWKNPWYIKYDYFWNYKVNLKILSSNWEEENTNFFVEFIAAAKNEKNIINEKEVSNNLDDENKSELIIEDNLLNKKTQTKIEILLYILIFIFTLNLIVLILRREKLI